MKPYVHEDENGNTLKLSPDGGRVEFAIDAVDAPFRAYPDDLPVITGKLYEACGEEAPLMLVLPEIPEGGEWKPDPDSLLRVSRDRDRLTVRTTMDGGAAVLTPAAARAMVVALAVLADEAEAEPDPEEVEELAHALRLELFPDSVRAGLKPSGADRTAARAALRWMNARGKRDE